MFEDSNNKETIVIYNKSKALEINLYVHTQTNSLNTWLMHAFNFSYFPQSQKALNSDKLCF